MLLSITVFTPIQDRSADVAAVIWNRNILHCIALRTRIVILNAQGSYGNSLR